MATKQPARIYYTVDVLQQVGIVTDDTTDYALSGEGVPPLKAAFMLLADHVGENFRGENDEFAFTITDPEQPTHKLSVVVKS